MNEENSNKFLEILQKIGQYILVLLNALRLLHRIRLAIRARKARKLSAASNREANNQKEGE